MGPMLLPSVFYLDTSGLVTLFEGIVIINY